jgi:hypothetical protein
LSIEKLIDVFDKKISGSNVKINLVEYCSTLGRSKEFGFDPNDKDKEYYAKYLLKGVSIICLGLNLIT